MSHLTGTTEEWGKPVTIPHGLYFTLNNVFVQFYAQARDKEIPMTKALEDCWIEYSKHHFKKDNFDA